MNATTEYIEKESRIARATERFEKALRTYVREVEILEDKVKFETDWSVYSGVLGKIADWDERLMEQVRSCASLAMRGFHEENPVRGCTALEALRRKT